MLVDSPNSWTLCACQLIETFPLPRFCLHPQHGFVCMCVSILALLMFAKLPYKLSLFLGIQLFDGEFEGLPPT